MPLSAAGQTKRSGQGPINNIGPAGVSAQRRLTLPMALAREANLPPQILLVLSVASISLQIASYLSWPFFYDKSTTMDIAKLKL